MRQGLHGTKSTTRGSIDGVFVMFSVFKPANPRFRREARSSTGFVSNFRRNSVSVGRWYRTRRSFCRSTKASRQTRASCKGFWFVTIWFPAAQRQLVRKNRRNTLRRSLITYCLLSRGVKYISAAVKTAVFLDYSSSLTVEEKGVRENPVKTGGHDEFLQKIIGSSMRLLA